jgi:hypothetical protein
MEPRNSSYPWSNGNEKKKKIEQVGTCNVCVKLELNDTSLFKWNDFVQKQSAIFNISKGIL